MQHIFRNLITCLVVCAFAWFFYCINVLVSQSSFYCSLHVVNVAPAVALLVTTQCTHSRFNRLRAHPRLPVMMMLTNWKITPAMRKGLSHIDKCVVQRSERSMSDGIQFKFSVNCAALFCGGGCVVC